MMNALYTPHISRLLLGIFLAALSWTGSGAGLELKETFCSCGYYWTPEKGDPAPTVLHVEFRKSGDPRWQRGVDAFRSPDDGMYRGSVVDLAENTPYELRLLAPDGQSVASGAFRTWSGTVPIARTVDIADRSRNGTIRISDRGKPDGWIRFTAPRGGILNGDRSQNNSAIEIDGAEYVILDGLTVRGGPVNGIEIKNSRFVRILNCDIGNWGRPGEFAPLPAKYVVRLIPERRDCLWRIAEYSFIYNNPLKWPVLYEANKKTFKDPSNPDLIFPGQVLVIPSIKGEARDGTWDSKKTYQPLAKK